METIKAWFRAHNITTHVVAGAIAALAVLVETDQHIRDVLLKDLDIHPKIISSLGALGAILLAYKQPRKTDGTSSVSGTQAGPTGPPPLPPTGPSGPPRKDS